MTRARALSRRIFAFAGVPFVALIAPLIFLPVLARLAGTDVWLAIAIGQSVGGFAALVGSVGYATLAPPLVAVAGAAERRRMLATSLHVRVPVWLVAAVTAVIIAAALAPATARAEAALMAAAMSLAALAPTWFWIGVGRAGPILWYEVLPRMAATLAATAILLVGGAAIWYPILLGISMVAGPAIVYARYSAGELRRVNRSEVVGVLRSHPPAVIAETAAGAYNALAVAIVATFTTPTQAARFVSGDKAYRIGQYSVAALGNALQGWVVEDGKDRQSPRMRVVTILHVALGLFGLVTFGLLGPWLTGFLFGAEFAIDFTTSFGFGVAILGIALGTAFGRIGLIVLGARKAFMTCVVSAAAVGSLALMVGASVGGAAGAAWALGSTELLSGIAQGVVFAVLWRRRSKAESTEPS